jgi:20S proteasome alpha/beta subunit
MTITVCVLVPAGIVLAADSRQMTESPPGHWRVDSDNADKIFQLGPHLAASIHGQGFLYPSGTESPRPIGAILRSATPNLSKRCTVKEAASLLHRKVTGDLKKHCNVTGLQQAGLAFHVAGYGPGQDIGELYRCDVPGGITLERRTNDAGMVWSGSRLIADRLILGYDPRMLELLALSESQAQLEDILRQQCRKLQLHISFQTMPLQDAVDLAVLLVRTTIELQRLTNGIVGAPGHAATCGGAIDVAVLTPAEGFQWLQCKPLEVRSR